MADTTMNSDTKLAFDEALLHQYTDQELLFFIESAPAIPLDDRFDSQTYTLSETLVAKHSYRYRKRWPADEIEAMQLAKRIGVRVPTLHRVVPAPKDQGAYLVMTRVQGRLLADAWPSLSVWRTIALAVQLARFVHLMRCMTSRVGGSLSTGASLCGAFEEDKYGPALHVSPVDFADYINWWLLLPRPPRYPPRPDLTILPQKTHVLCHMDLNPHNMIVDSANRLWIIDWQDCGFYPAYMECEGMRWTLSSWDRKLSYWRWCFFKWMATGHHPKEVRAIAMVRDRSMTFPRARTGFPSGRQSLVMGARSEYAVDRSNEADTQPGPFPLASLPPVIEVPMPM